jgi:hypothetical protein
VAVEGGGRDADLPGQLAQAQAAEVLVLQQAQARVEQRLPGLLLLRPSGARPGLPGARPRLRLRPSEV